MDINLFYLNGGGGRHSIMDRLLLLSIVIVYG